MIHVVLVIILLSLVYLTLLHLTPSSPPPTLSHPRHPPHQPLRPSDGPHTHQRRQLLRHSASGQCGEASHTTSQSAGGRKWQNGHPRVSHPGRKGGSPDNPVRRPRVPPTAQNSDRP